MSRDFPGTDGNGFLVGDVAAVDITGTALTFSAWVFLDRNNAVNVFANKGTATATDRQFMFFTDASGKLGLIIGDSAGIDQVTGATTVSTGVWAHVVGRKNGTGASALQVFLNGTSDASATSNKSIQNTTHDFLIGYRASPAANCDGRIAELAVWNVALSDTDIAALAKGASPQLFQRAGLKGYWPLLGTGSPERDYSGGGSHGTVTGSVSAGTRHAPVMPFVLPTRVPFLAPATSVVYQDDATVYVDIQPTGADIADISDLATVLVDVQPSGVDVKEQFDIATIYVDLQVLGGECFSTFSSENFGEGEANLRWASTSNLRWSSEANLRWSALVSIGDSPHC